ncbi:MAG: glutathione S-transferase family protein [Betaproteobacteria bacterium]|nr:glutathione S-transferase family protein [Betaproteobacteria bacterium]
MRYELYYWPGIQGRGEFVRLALEEAAADYVDIARMPARAGMGMPALMRLLEDTAIGHPPFALPALKAGKQVIAQTANILLFLGPRLDLAPKAEAGRLWAHQLQLTIADFISEAHDVHHPIASGLYYEAQKREAKRRAQDFRVERLPKFLGYFEDVLARNAGGGNFMIGRRRSYVDLSMFQVLAGLSYAFPRAMARLKSRWPRLVALYQRVMARPRIAAYLASSRRLPFNPQGIFRHYPELDG